MTTCVQVCDDVCSHPYKIRLPSYSHWHASELRGCVKMEEAVLRSQSLIILVASVDVKQHSTGTQSLTLISRPPWGPFPTSVFHFTHLQHHAFSPTLSPSPPSTSVSIWFHLSNYRASIRATTEVIDEVGKFSSIWVFCVIKLYSHILFCVRACLLLFLRTWSTLRAHNWCKRLINTLWHYITSSVLTGTKQSLSAPLTEMSA